MEFLSAQGFMKQRWLGFVRACTFCARIGEGAVITPEGKPANADGENYCVRDGVVVVPKGTVIPAGTLI